jgi:ABC-type polysaccharide/polyol phosphate export permease
LKTPPPPNAGTDSYAVYLFAGMLPWLLFSDTVQRSSASIVEASNLVTKTMFPSEIVPVSIFLSSMLSHLLTVALFLVIATVLAGHLSAMILLLPVFVLLTGMLAVGIGWIASSLHVYLRDTAQVVSVVLTLWMWITPIMILERQIPERFRLVLFMNPMFYIVRVYRQMLLGGSLPSLRDVVMAAAFAVITFVAGGLFFRQMKRGFADVL